MNAQTQNQAILKYLKRGKKLTALTALKLFGSLRLSARIYNLRHDGYNVLSRIVTRNGKHVAEYWLGYGICEECE